MKWEPLEVVEMKQFASGAFMCFVLWKPHESTILCKGWISQDDLIRSGYSHLIEAYNVRASAHHTKESFQNELQKENGFVILQPGPHDVYPSKSFQYTRSFIYREGTAPPDESFLSGCACSSICDVNSPCPCVSMNPLGNSPYVNRCLNTLQDYIIECNSKCVCGPSCPNRVVQNGVQVKMVLRYIPEKGWSVFADQNISKGAFIAEYLGELITQSEAKKRERRSLEKKLLPFLFDMDFYEDMLAQGGGTPENELKSIDAQHFGNISRFFNHSCSPNLITKPCFYDSAVNYVFTRIAFFTSRNIKKGEELCFDYEGKHKVHTSTKRTKSNSKKQLKPSYQNFTYLDYKDSFQFTCQCGSSNCRGTVF